MYQLYADDTQLNVSFKFGRGDPLSSAKSSIEICVQEINDWMIFNGLKLNDEKTELVLLSSRHWPSPALEFVRVVDQIVHQSTEDFHTIPYNVIFIISRV